MKDSLRPDNSHIEDLISAVPKKLVDRFDSLYTEWMEAVNTSHTVAFSSDPSIVRTLPEFAKLTELGSEILPLVVKKLLDPSNFFAIQVYEALQTRPDLLV